MTNTNTAQRSTSRRAPKDRRQRDQHATKDNGLITLAQFRHLPEVGYAHYVGEGDTHSNLVSAVALTMDASQLFNPGATGITVADSKRNIDRCKAAAFELLPSRVAAGTVRRPWQFLHHWFREQREVDGTKALASASRACVQRLQMLGELPEHQQDPEEVDCAVADVLELMDSMPGRLVSLFAVLVPLADAKDALLIGIDFDLLNVVHGH